MSIKPWPKAKHGLHVSPYHYVGMGEEMAYLNGYKHGFEGIVTEDICCLTTGSKERLAWLRGYADGAFDLDPPPIPDFVYYPYEGD